MHVAFPKDTFDKLVNYLGSKPFNEVENLINELKATVKPVNITEPVKEGVDENVLSTQAESGQSQTQDEGGQPNQSQEPEEPVQG